MSSIFTKIINREIPAEIIWEDENFIAFMDAFPAVHGHVLVCPKKEIDYLFDLDNTTYAGLWEAVKKISTPLQKATEVKRICLQVEGFQVPHVHVHLLPQDAYGEEAIARDISKEAIAEIAEKIRKEIALADK